MADRLHHKGETMAKGRDQKKEVRSKSKEDSSKKVAKKELAPAEKSSKKPIKAKVDVAEPTPEEILKSKKTEAKAAKKAGPKSDRAKNEESAEEVPAKKTDAKKQPVKQARTRLERRGKNYRKVHEALDKSKVYSLDQAIEILPKTSFVKFDPSVELHIKLGVDPKQADQNIRATVVLPHSNGKSQRVAVLAAKEKQKAAKDAGADIVGEADLLEEIKKGNFNFDILVATPDMMAGLGKFAKTLGPKGLMPNPKSGTVTNDIAKTVKELKGGRIEFRVDPSGIIHQSIGKLSLKGEGIKANASALISAVKSAKPTSVKGVYMEKIYITTSMGPSLQLEVKEASE